MPFRTASLALAASGLLLTGTAQAIEYNQVDATRSSLAFTSKQMGVPVPGSFKRFNASIAFDPARPTAASTTLEIDLASIDAGSREANDEVVGKQWFNVKAHPTARFVSTGVRALGNNRFEALGKMTVKGQTRDVVAPFTFKQEGSGGVFDGGFVLKRMDYGIGEGPWADVSAVANEIEIKFRVVANAGPAKK
ncbi:YceI family protein [Zoogloea sp.]|uniref:YceI family protein n=1 Tax=Zoogloea sp. TaxID=49181 RepID=UPI0026028C3C|nr:YceI family protein [Zoogloea sp.]MDD3352263.1 YceI family protein [Zoogloea sp.]